MDIDTARRPGEPKPGAMRPRILLGFIPPALLLLAALLAPRLVLAPLADWLHDEDPPAAADSAGADVVIALAGGSSRRVVKALELCRAGYATRIALTTVGAPSSDLEDHEGERWTRLLTRAGFAADSIDVLSPSFSTFDDARLVRDYLVARGYTRAIVVSDPFHTRRVGWIVRRVLTGTDVTVRIVASDQPRLDPDRWWRDELALGWVVSEYVKLGYYGAAYGFREPIDGGPVGFHTEEAP